MAKYCRSTFTLTFAIEIVGSQVWEDCKEGPLDQGSCDQGLRLQYQLYPGQTYDLDILIWPHTAKVSYGGRYCWVRTWQFLERRWLTFSISHAFPVRVVDLKGFVAIVNLSSGSSAKSDKNFQVYLPPLGFGVRRYFGPVLDSEESLLKFASNLIWHAVEQHIPWSCFDELFDVPHVVTDVRHQDACLDRVRDLILKRLKPPVIVPPETQLEVPIVKSVKESKVSKEKDKNKNGKESKASRDKTKDKNGKESKVTNHKDKKKGVEVHREKFEIKLSGESILAGTGRIVPFETSGDPPPDSPEIIALISSNNLPAQDDLPIVFLNVENLCQIPLNELKILRITHLYTKWKLGDEVHSSQPQPLLMKSTIGFNDHRALPIPPQLLPTITADFLGTDYVIEVQTLRTAGVDLTTTTPSAALVTASFTRYQITSSSPKIKTIWLPKGDRDFGTVIPLPTSYELDFLIAITRIDASKLARGLNSFLSGEYPLFPPQLTVRLPEREGFCTNDINCMRADIIPELVVPPDVILQAQMSLEVSIGVVGCKTRNLCKCYSRMFCTVKDTEAIMEILRCITAINGEMTLSGKRDDLLSGFALDAGNIVILYVEGPKDGYILRVWEMTEDFYPKLKPLFSCSDRYSSRIYPELLASALPFVFLKMYAPLNILLACPPVYARPALPLPTRTAVLKLGALIGCNLRSVPSQCKMPTAAELQSFRLELCVAPRPSSNIITDTLGYHDQGHTSLQSASRINWDKPK